VGRKETYACKLGILRDYGWLNQSSELSSELSPQLIKSKLTLKSHNSYLGDAISINIHFVDFKIENLAYEESNCGARYCASSFWVAGATKLQFQN
jgi:hypothetical protein